MMCIFMILFTIILIYANEYKGPCRERNRFMSVDQVNEFEMLDVNLGKTAILECRYCDEDGVNEPRIWLRTKHVNRTAIQDEVKLGMIANLTSNRIYMTLDHCLYVQKITKDDAGLYFCKGLEGDDTDFQYSVDVVSEHTKIIKGELTKWNTFINKTITPLNLNISKSIDNEIVKLINVTGVFVKVMSEWEDWGPCDGCLETRERIAKCRIKPKINHVIHPLHNSTMTEDLHNLLSSLKLSCHSLQLQERLPHLSQLVSNVPNFLITEDCIGPCKQRKSGKGAKYHNTYHLLERSFVTFICPETNLSSVVVWRKNGKVIKTNTFSSSNSLSSTVYVDTFNILHFEGAKLIDKGNYTCYVNKVQMQEIIISIGSHPLFDFAMFGLGFVFLFFMSLFVYSAGVVIAYNRRYMYKSLKFV